jgi:transposase
VPEIAKHTGLSEASVYRIIAEYNEFGPEALDTRNKVVDQGWFGQRVNPVSM